MSIETGVGSQTIDSSSDRIDLRLKKEREIDAQENEPSASELTPRLVDERIKQAIDPIFRRIEDFCALLVVQTELESAGNSDDSGSRRDNAFTGPSRDRHDSHTSRKWQVENNKLN